MIEDSQIVGSWKHSHEEDRDQQQMFRPADYPLPPARGRTVFTLLPDHRAVVGTPGPDDRGASHSGTWSLERQTAGDVLSVALPGWQESYVVVSASAGQLVVQPVVR